MELTLLPPCAGGKARPPMLPIRDAQLASEACRQHALPIKLSKVLYHLIVHYVYTYTYFRKYFIYCMYVQYVQEMILMSSIRTYVAMYTCTYV